jgi:HK97 gp10 family phage protein
MSVTQLDVTQLAIDLNNAGEMAGRSLDDLMLFIANSMAQDMQAIVPVDTGNLKSAIKVTKEGEGRYRVGPDLVQAPYAWFVEFGTKPHIIEAKPGKTLRFQKDGKTIYTKRVRHPGTRAQPYVRPVLANWVDRLGSDAVKVGVQEVVSPS